MRATYRQTQVSGILECQLAACSRDHSRQYRPCNRANCPGSKQYQIMVKKPLSIIIPKKPLSLFPFPSLLRIERYNMDPSQRWASMHLLDLKRDGRGLVWTRPNNLSRNQTVVDSYLKLSIGNGEQPIIVVCLSTITTTFVLHIFGKLLKAVVKDQGHIHISMNKGGGIYTHINVKTLTY